jgi:hypothetical protein
MLKMILALPTRCEFIGWLWDTNYEGNSNNNQLLEARYIMNGSQQATINEIKKLIEEDNIEIEAALRLTLASQIIITEELGEIKKQSVRSEENVDEQMLDIINDVGSLRKCGETKLDEIERHLEKYPSISWYWQHRRKTLLLLILGIMVVYTVLFGSINISDIRQAVLGQLGLPTDLGLGP